MYNLGVCYLSAGDPVKAEEALLKSLRINPFHAKSHMAVAKANFAMGRIAQSYLAYNMAILISPGLKNLKEFGNAITGRLNVIPRLIRILIRPDMITVIGTDRQPCFRPNLPLKMNLNIRMI